MTELAAAYTELRPLLLRVAYAVLGSVSEAEDVVSDVWLRLSAAQEREPVRDLQAWATVAVSRRALDVLRSARVRRESYVGPWLPEPMLGSAAPGPEPMLGSSAASPDPADRVTLDETVGYALLVVLEALSPAERTAWVLHDLFGMAFTDVADVVGRTPAAVRQLAARARDHVASRTPRVRVTPAEHRATLEAFTAACADGDVDALVTVLDPAVTITSDGGGEVVAAKRPVRGVERAATFLLRVTRGIGPGQRAEMRPVNGLPGLVVVDGERVVTVMSLTLDAGRVTRIDIVRAPGKLAHLGAEAAR